MLQTEFLEIFISRSEPQVKQLCLLKHIIFQTINLTVATAEHENFQIVKEDLLRNKTDLLIFFEHYSLLQVVMLWTLPWS